MEATCALTHPIMLGAVGYQYCIHLRGASKLVCFVQLPQIVCSCLATSALVAQILYTLFYIQLTLLHIFGISHLKLISYVSFNVLKMPGLGYH